jgi:hypothetical protein
MSLSEQMARDLAEANRHKSNTILAKVWVSPDEEADALLAKIRAGNDGFAARISDQRPPDPEGYGALIEIMAQPTPERIRQLALNGFEHLVRDLIGDADACVDHVEFA